MKKKYILSGVYLIGWLYPLSVVVYTIADRYLKIRTSLMGPFDFGNDSIMGYVGYSLIFALITFLIFFITVIVKFRISKWFYLALLNLPIYCGAVYSPIYSDIPHYSILIYGIFPVIVIATIVLTLLLLFKAEKKAD